MNEWKICFFERPWYIIFKVIRYVSRIFMSERIVRQGIFSDDYKR